MPENRRPPFTVLFLVGGFIVGYVGLLLLSGGIASIRRNRAFGREGVPVNATIVRSEEKSAPSTPSGPGYRASSRMHIIYYRYRTPDGREHEGNTYPPRNYASSLGIGDTIQVSYLRSDPGESRLESDYAFSALLALLGIAVGGAGIAMIVVGGEGLFRARSR